MAAPPITEIENEFSRLSPEAQLGLLERLVHRMRLTAAGHQQGWEADLAAMAADPEMRRELRQINSEFRTL
jgi:hypothetical protein